MAFGIFPKSTKTLSPENSSKEQTLLIAEEVFKRFDWDVSFKSETGMIAHSGFSMSSWGEEITVKQEYGNTTVKSESNGGQFFDWGKNQRNVNSFILEFENIKKEWKQEEQETKWLELQKQFVPKEKDVLSQPPITSKDKVTTLLSIFVPIEGYYITPILINLNILIFIAMVFTGADFLNPTSDILVKWGGNYRPATMDGEWWRLFTSCFLHIGVLHLLMNIYALIYIGILLEPYLGKIRFTAAYLLTGIAASLASLWWHDYVVSAGASGSIFGMYGIFLALLTTDFMGPTVKKTFLSSIIIFVFYNLISGVQVGQNVDNAAHIGGLISGLLIGYAFIPGLKRPELLPFKWAPIGATVLILAGMIIAAPNYISNDIGIYMKEMKRFAEQENIALEIYNMPDSTTTEQWLDVLENKGLANWKKNRQLLEEMKKLDLPLEIKVRNVQLDEYCELRIKTYELYYKGFQEDTGKYKQQIEEYDKEVEDKLKELSGEQ